ncbi:hypothetical protein BDY21DRAFT_401799 [Lineolata rhizophorae]|uniref:Cytoplasmic tRNA 2-thiolation protein 2 n=1 Tax=Lineolata rhizophorae TaxID=578093 RepID=A0A6A6NPE9_9PEZI|nr:hypothetical protein BDY21DRAFT_401799 [Lineolata rhizophorae]
MASRNHERGVNGLGQQCRRCQANESSIIVRNEALCAECLVKYIQTKVIKRLESFRVRHSAPGRPRKLLLPLSLGISSLTLLHILDGHLRGQRSNTGRTGYALHILHVTTSVQGQWAADPALLKKVKECYPDHVYFAIPLASIFDGDESNGARNTTSAGDHVPSSSSNQNRLDTLLTSLPTPASRSDIISILQTRLIVSFARTAGCESILWGDSTTRLAEKVLASTAKGRGFALPWHICDGPTPYGIDFHYPVRDLLKKELLEHAPLATSSVADIATAPPAPPTPSAAVNVRSSTIDGLVAQYFLKAESDYPSIVSNAVRTAAKLEAAPSDRWGRDGSVCRLCKLPVAEGLFGVTGWGGGRDGGVESRGSEGELCYGCTRSVPRDVVSLLP